MVRFSRTQSGCSKVSDGALNQGFCSLNPTSAMNSGKLHPLELSSSPIWG